MIIFGNAKAVFFQIALCLCVSTGNAESIFAVSGLPYSEDRIWVLEHGNEYTLPYNGQTTMPDHFIYRGIIRNVDGTPAAHAGFDVQVSAGTSKSDGPVQTQVTGIELYAGADGRFRYALQGYAHHGIIVSGRDYRNVFSRSREAFKLKAGTENIIISRLLADVPAQLVRADGRLLQLKEPPAIYSTDESLTSTESQISNGEKLASVSPTLAKLQRSLPEQGPPPGPAPLLKGFGKYSSLGSLRSLPPSKSYGDAELNINTESTTTPFILRRVAVPGHYSMVAMGRVFKSFYVTTTSTVVKLFEDAKPFTVSGVVTDTDGNPVEGAFVMIRNGYVNWVWDELPYDALQQLWEITAGNFDVLGFYLVRTDAEGRYQVSGDCVGAFSTLYVHADGYGPVTKQQFIPDQKAALSADSNATTVTKFEEGYSGLMFGGEATLQPLVIARTAVVKVELSTEDGPLNVPQNTLHFPAHVEISKFNSGQLGDRWDLKPESKYGTTYLTVPAGVAFELTFGPFAKRDETDAIVISEPLAPGEVRDIGAHKLDVTGRGGW